LIALLEAHDGRLGPMEKRLSVSLLHQALAVSPEWAPSDIALAATLCHRMKPVLGRYPWSEIVIAANDVCVAGDYQAALERLERDRVKDLPTSLPWIATARVLLGQTPFEERGAAGDAFAAMEAVVLSLSESTNRSSDGDAALAERLRRAAVDPWCRGIPALSATVAGLDFVLQPQARLTDVTHAIRRAPPWVHWLVARAALLHWNGETASFPAELSADIPAIAWQIEAAWSHYGQTLGPAPQAIIAAGACLDAWQAATPLDSGVVALRKARNGGAASDGTPIRRTSFLGWALGNRVGEWALLDLGIEATYLSAGAALERGNLEAAVQRADRVLLAAERTPSMVGGFWLPQLRYARAALTARWDGAEASVTLAELTSSPKSKDARAQLALLAIQRDDLAEAARRISDLAPTTQAVAYAQALLSARRGDAPGARRLLGPLVALEIPSRSPYPLAARRLLGAIDERAGDSAAAETQYREIVSTTPGDAISQARLARLLVRRAYSEASQPEGAAQTAKEGIVVLDHAKAEIGWLEPYEAVYRLLTQSAQESKAVLASIEAAAVDVHTPRSELARRQLAARNLVKSGQVERALALLGSSRDGIGWRDRSRETVKGFITLAHLGRIASGPIEPSLALAFGQSLSGTLAQMRELKTAAVPAAFQRIETLAAFAQGELARPSMAVPREIGAAIDPALADLPLLFSKDGSVRAAAGAAIHTATEARNASWIGAQRSLLIALAAQASGADDRYLEQYAALASHLDELPVLGADLWLAAATLWCHQKAWSRLLQGDLPSCVADLESPRARLLIGLAYAGEAAEAASRDDTRKALHHLNRARSTLEPIAAVG